MKRQITAMLTAIAILTGTSAPALAEGTDTADISDTAVICEAETSEETPAELYETADADTSSETEDDVPEESFPDEQAEEPCEYEDDVPEEDIPDEQPAATTDTSAEILPEDTLTNDEEELLASGWYTWDNQNGVLTLRGQLPDTDYENETDYNIAYFAHIPSESVRKIVIESGTKAGQSTKHMFSELTKLTEIQGLRNLDTSEVTKMNGMFWNCSSLRSIDLSGFDTSNVQYFSGMFYDCEKLTSLDLSGFNTSKAMIMTLMFSGCKHLTTLDLSGFDTSHVTYMDMMFEDCENLRSVDLSGFDTRQNKSLFFMFRNCSSLEYIDLSSFDTSKCASAVRMFEKCSSLRRITVSDKWNAGNFERSDDMFTGCFSLSGSRGTVYDDRHTDALYARIDGGSYKPGYLTGSAYIPRVPSIVIKPVFGGKSVTFTGLNTSSDIYYHVGSSDISFTCRYTPADKAVFFNKPMTGRDACIYFKTYDNAQWSPLGKWGLLNVKIDKPLIVQSGSKSANNFKVYTQTKDSYIIYTLDGSTPSIQEGSNKLKVTNGRIVWGTSAVINVPKGRTVRAVAVRCGLVTSDVMTYTNK